MTASPAFTAAVDLAAGRSRSFASVSVTELRRVLLRHKLVGHAQAAEGLTPEQRADLEPDWRAINGAALAQLAERDRVVAALHADYVPCIAYKGVTLQQWLQGRIDGRESADLDLWVPPLLFRRTLRWAVRDGYTLAFDLTERDLDARHLPSELLAIHPSGLHLDVHQRFFAAHYALDAAEEFLEGYVPWLDEQTPAEAARFGDLAMAFLVALTGAKDTWATLRHLSDLRIALERVDRSALTELADGTHTRKLVDTGVHLVRTVLGVEVDWETRFSIADDAGRICRAAVLPGAVERARVYLASRERKRDRLSYIGGLPFRVSALDLPGGSAWPRMARRGARLFRSHVLGDGNA